MNSVLTYVDANVLIAAFRAQSALSAAAIGVLRDPGRAILVSDALWLETIPKATYHRQEREVAFYEGIFSLAHKRIGWSQAITSKACELAPRYGLAAMDAVHVAAAIVGGAEELITGEKWGKPMLRVSEIRVRSLQPSPESAP
jgi:predicted nucleic acid-binding protein